MSVATPKSGFENETDWATSPRAAPGPPQKLTRIQNDFFDDFDDDDEAFFNNSARLDAPPAAENSSSAAGNMFGMLSLNHEDADAPSLPAPTAALEEGEEDGVELLELDKQYLVHLRDAHSSYRTIARCCLAIHQLIYSKHDCCSENYSSPLHSDTKQMHVNSSSIYHDNHFQRITSRIISSLATCLQHSTPAVRSLACKTLGAVARSSYARLQFDPQLASEAPHNFADRVQEDCLGVGYTLILTAVEDEDDTVSASALEALGLFTLDPNDSLNAEVKSLAENVDPNQFTFQHFSHNEWINSHSLAMKEIQFKVFNNTIFPRMGRLLTRMRMYPLKDLVKAIPVVTASFLSAVKKGPETIPARRAMMSNKISHGKRGWMETDSEGLVREYVECVLFPCFNEGGFNALQRAAARSAALACIRLSDVSPLASWGAKASRYAMATLIRQLNEETANSFVEKDAGDGVTCTLSSAIVPLECIAGSVALLIIALRGIPLQERAAGVICALRATLLFLPMAVLIPAEVNECSQLDVPLSFIPGEKGAYRLGRIGLLAEIAALILIDGTDSIEHLKANEFIEPQPLSVGVTESEQGKDKILGARAILLNHILQSHHLSSIWDSQQKKNNQIFRPVDEMVWVLCSVLLQIGRDREHDFSNEFSLLVEWSNMGLVLLDNFGKFVCRPVSSSPFSQGAQAAYTNLMVSLVKKSGLLPPSSLSLRDNMLPSWWVADSTPSTTIRTEANKFNLSVVGGPGRQMPHVSTALSKISINVLVLWNKARTAYPQGGGNLRLSSAGNIVLAAVIVDAWIGRCIINHDTKQSNEGQLEVAPGLLSLLQTEMNTLLESLRATSDSESILSTMMKEDQSSYFNATIHLFRVCIASMESVAMMSVILWDIENRSLEGDVEALENKIVPLAVSILQNITGLSKEALDMSANEGRDVMILSLYQQVAIDANDAVARIEEFFSANAEAKSQYDDIAASLPQLSSRDGRKGKTALELMFRMTLICSVGAAKSEKKATINELSSIRELSPSLISHLKPIHQCAFFLYHHARLVVSRLVSNALKASALAFPSSSAPKRVHSALPHRLLRSFHSVIEMYHRPQDLTVLMPVPRKEIKANTHFIGSEPVTLTGCSDPVYLTMSHDIRRVRRADSSEQVLFVVTMRLYNITPVPIKNGVRLEWRTCQESHHVSDCVASAVYKNEINGGDFVTWQTSFDSWCGGNILLQASITFRDMEQESITRKWVSASDDGLEGSTSYVNDDDDESTMDITLTCPSVTLSVVSGLHPCPLVYFGAHHKNVLSGLGDEVAFCFLWTNMTLECSRTFVSKTEVKLDTAKGYIIVQAPDSNPSSTGCALVTPNGIKVLCLLENRGSGSYLLRIRSDSLSTLQSLVGSIHSQSAFFNFLFGAGETALLDDKPS